MSVCPNGAAPLSPVQIFQLLKTEADKHGTGNNLIGLIVGTSIVLRESGGCKNAYRDQSQNPGGGNDRGLVQFNSKAFPNITDTQAFDPVQAIALFYENSEGFTKFKPWSGAPLTAATLDQALKASSDAGYNYGGTGQQILTAIGDTWTGSGQAGETASNSPYDQTKDAAESVIDSVTGWTTGLTSLLANLVSGEWWKRIGIGALGLLIITVGLILLFGKDAANTIGKATI